jgi:toxin secretion/phage lysis holin
MDAVKMSLAAVLGVAAVRTETVVPLTVMVIVAILFDYITGLLAGRLRPGGLKSHIAARGLYKKVGFLLLFFFGLFMDVAIPWFIHAGLTVELPFNLPFGMILAAWIVLTESISVLENLVVLGVRPPRWMMRLLKTTKKQIDTQDKEGKR